MAFLSGLVATLVEWLSEKVFVYFKAQALLTEEQQRELAEAEAEAKALIDAQTGADVENDAHGTLDHL